MNSPNLFWVRCALTNKKSQNDGGQLNSFQHMILGPPLAQRQSNPLTTSAFRNKGLSTKHHEAHEHIS